MYGVGMTGTVLVPISDKKRVTRERVIQFSRNRPDFMDTVGQICLLAYQLHGDQYTGSVTINFGQGSVRNIQLSENVKDG
jgi:hypothetical protein